MSWIMMEKSHLDRDRSGKIHGICYIYIYIDGDMAYGSMVIYV